MKSVAEDRVSVVTIVLAIAAVTMLLCAGCDGQSDQIPPGSYSLTMSFQGVALTGHVTVNDNGVGTWEATNPENAYAGAVVSSERETVWWFGSAHSSAFELHTVDGRSTDPAIEAIITLASVAR